MGYEWCSGGPVWYWSWSGVCWSSGVIGGFGMYGSIASVIDKSAYPVVQYVKIEYLRHRDPAKNGTDRPEGAP
jgi:hypothetical protein